MIQIPLQKIIEKIKDDKGLSEDEVNSKIKQKLDMLSGLISKEGAAHIVANELGVKLIQASGLLKVADIHPGMRNLETAGRVLRKFDVREFAMKDGSPGKVGSFIMSDGNAEVRVVLWHDKTKNLEKLEPNTLIKIREVYSKKNNDNLEIHSSGSTEIIVNPEGVDIPELTITAGPQTGQRKKISELTENDSSVEILGTIVQVFDIKFFEVCPQCRKRVREQEGKFNCPVHGQVEPDYNYVLTTFLDDGTDNIRCAFFGNQVDGLLEMGNQQVKEFIDNMSKFEAVKVDLLGKIVKVTGRANKNAMFDRLELMVNTVDPKPNPQEEIKKIEQ